MTLVIIGLVVVAVLAGLLVLVARGLAYDVTDVVDSL